MCIHQTTTPLPPCDTRSNTRHTHREQSSALLHRSAHYLQTRQLADALESQAGTWQLLLHLYAMGEAPAGLGGPELPDAGGRQTYRQALRDAVNGDARLERVAHVVAWLESLAAQRLEARPPPGFSAADGVWRETLLLSRGAGSGGAVELDPDAPTRGAAALRGEDRRNEERLAAALWALLRAGKPREAQELCRRCGQHWRAAALAGGGPWGPLPVGAAAADADDAMAEEAQAEDLSWEVEAGRGTGRALWRWSCAAAADAAASATPANKWEAAVFGALAGHVARALPACASWEDEAWAYCRAWLDLGADERAAALEAGDVAAGFGARMDQEARAGGASGDGGALAAAVPAEALAALLEGAGAAGYTQAANNRLLQEGLGVAASDSCAAAAALPRLRQDAGGRALVPASFDDLGALLAASANSNVRAAAAGDQQRSLQLHLMAERWRELVLELASAALQAHREQQEQEAAQRAAGLVVGAGGAAGVGSTSTAAAAAASGALQRRAGDAGFALLRFAAHLALALRALGLVRDPALTELLARAHGLDGLDEDEEQEAARLQEALGKVIHQYADALAAHPAGWPLVPPYLCHLRARVRGALLARLVRAATSAGAGDAACLALHAQLADALEAWRARQARLEEAIAAGRLVGDPDCAPTSLLTGDVRPDELRCLLAGLLEAARRGPGDGPLARVRLLRWLFYPFVAAQRAAAALATAAADADADPDAAEAAAEAAERARAWDASWRDALRHAAGIAAELALSPGAAAARALRALFDEALPGGFLEAAAAAAEEQLPALAAGDDDDGALEAAPRAVERRLAALAFWQSYAALDADYRSWKADLGAALLSSAGGAADLGHGAEAAAARSEALAARLLDLAEADALAALAAPEEDLVGGEAADPTRVRLLVVAAGAEDGGGFKSAIDARQLQQRLAPALAALTAASPDVTAAAALPGDAGDAGAADQDGAELEAARAAGAVAVCLSSFQPPPAPDAPDHERLRVHHKALRAWEAMAAKTAWLLSGAGAREGADGGDSGLPPLPRLVPVAVEASFATVAQAARHRTSAKLLARAGKVLLALARAGHDAAALSERLVELAAGARAPAGAPHLTELLAPADARRLLRLVEAAAEELPAEDAPAA